MKLNLARTVAAAGIVAAAAVGTAAQARDVYWSLGVQAAPGVAIGVSNARPVVVAPAPVYIAPQPVYVAPQPVYVAPRPVYVAPQPVYYAEPAPVVVYPGYRRGWHKHHHRHWD